MKFLVTGGAGFIGSTVARYLLTHDDDVVVVDALTYAGTMQSLEDLVEERSFRFVQADIRDRPTIRQTLAEEQPDVIIHLAAETHVDHSIDGPSAFLETNVAGTVALLDVATEYWRSRNSGLRFHHVSTDEVFGSLGDEGVFTASSPYAPRSPYAASKAASDHFVSAWHETYGLPTVISNCSSNYGPRQFPEKLIPHMIIRGLRGQSLPVYGTGSNVRDWLHVEDHAGALRAIALDGLPGSTYLVGGSTERTNLQIVQLICDFLDELVPRSSGESHHDLITFVEDRPGHDHRYAIDASATTAELGWQPTIDFETGLLQTVVWYLENRSWWQTLLEQGYEPIRVGLGSHG